MLTDADLVSLVMQKQAAGDTRTPDAIATDIRALDAAVNPPPAPPAATAVIGGGVQVLPDGTKRQITVYGDGSTVVAPVA